ncbi:MAG: carboxypeptidase-like regulatory domain-containing protein [Candidatus Acidiferrum sp.]
MKHGPLLCFGVLLAFAMGVSWGALPATAQTSPKPSSGTVSGVVRDSAGIPQLGATVEMFSEAPGVLAARQFLTNTQGIFKGDKLAPGFYTVRVTLAGFLPSLEKHIRISSNLTTVVRVQLESMFASVEQLRRPPTNGAAEPDDWKWVLRSAPGLRPVLQWTEDSALSASTMVLETNTYRPHGRVELTNGARRPGSISSIGAAPGTSFAYDQPIDRYNRIVFAGQVSYDQDSPAGGLAAIWLPTGSSATGPQSTIVLREAKIGPQGPTFRGVRLDQTGSLTFGERFLLRVGGEYVLVGTGSSAWSVRPRLKLESRLASNWYLNLIYASLPTTGVPSDTLASDLIAGNAPSNLSNALNQLDTFPALLWRNGRPVLENGQHEEMALEHKMGSRGALQVAAFHDDNRDVAIYGRGMDLPSSEFIQDYYSKGFAYDGGSSSDWGARLALRQKITDDVEFTTVYAFAGALVPTSDDEGVLREALRTMPRHSLAAKVSAKVPRTGTSLSTGYKWVSGMSASRVDPYGESIYQINPYLYIGIRQPLPKFALGRWEANAECDNLFAQGYVPLSTPEGLVLLVPAFRSFRGGLSLQF